MSGSTCSTSTASPFVSCAIAAIATANSRLSLLYCSCVQWQAPASKLAPRRARKRPHLSVHRHAAESAGTLQPYSTSWEPTCRRQLNDADPNYRVTHISSPEAHNSMQNVGCAPDATGRHQRPCEHLVSQQARAARRSARSQEVTLSPFSSANQKLHFAPLSGGQPGRHHQEQPAWSSNGRHIHLHNRLLEATERLSRYTALRSMSNNDCRPLSWLRAQPHLLGWRRRTGGDTAHRREAARQLVCRSLQIAAGLLSDTVHRRRSVGPARLSAACTTWCSADREVTCAEAMALETATTPRDKTSICFDSCLSAKQPT